MTPRLLAAIGLYRLTLADVDTFGSYRKVGGKAPENRRIF